MWKHRRTEWSELVYTAEPNSPTSRSPTLRHRPQRASSAPMAQEADGFACFGLMLWEQFINPIELPRRGHTISTTKEAYAFTLTIVVG